MRCPLPPGSRVWAYTRDSGGEDQSIGDQNRAVSSYCEENELVLEHLFCDEARPGSSVAGRERFEEMIHLARNLPKEHLPQGLVIWRFSRFGRNYDDSQFFKADLRRRGFVLVAIADDIPSDNGYGRVIEAFTDWHNEQFLKELSKDVKRGLRDLAKQGYCPGGFPPAGYKVEKDQIGTRRNGQPRFASRWVIDPEKAPAVRRAWEMRAAGSSYAEIHEATHVHNAKGSYNSMFKCVTYLGVLRCGDLEIEGAIEPLISREIWDAVQKRFRKRPRKGSHLPTGHPRAWAKKSTYLLSGLARCLYCGAAMVAGKDNTSTRPNPWPYYVCRQKKGLSYQDCEGIKVQGHLVEEAVMEAVISQILVPEFVMTRVQGVNEQLNQDQAIVDVQINDTRSRLSEVSRAIGNLLDLAESFGAQAAAERLLEREKERTNLEATLTALEQRKRQQHLEVTPEVVEDVLSGIREKLTTGAIRARRELLRQFVDRVEIGRKSGKLYYYSFPLEMIIPTGMWLVPPRRFELLSRA